MDGVDLPLPGLGRARDPRYHLQQLIARNAPAIGITKRHDDSGTGGGDGGKARRLEHLRRGEVPRVGQNLNLRLVVQLAKPPAPPHLTNLGGENLRQSADRRRKTIVCPTEDYPTLLLLARFLGDTSCSAVASSRSVAPAAVAACAGLRFSARLRLRASMMSITGAMCSAGAATTFLPSILSSIIFCRLSRYWS